MSSLIGHWFCRTSNHVDRLKSNRDTNWSFSISYRKHSLYKVTIITSLNFLPASSLHWTEVLSIPWILQCLSTSCKTTPALERLLPSFHGFVGVLPDIKSITGQDGGIGRHSVPPHTTKRRITTNLKTKDNQNWQKIKLYGSLTTKELK